MRAFVGERIITCLKKSKNTGYNVWINGTNSIQEQQRCDSADEILARMIRLIEILFCFVHSSGTQGLILALCKEVTFCNTSKWGAYVMVDIKLGSAACMACALKRCFIGGWYNNWRHHVEWPRGIIRKCFREEELGSYCRVRMNTSLLCMKYDEENGI